MVDIQVYGAKNNSAPQSGQARLITLFDTSKHGACYFWLQNVLASLPGPMERARRTGDGPTTTVRDRRYVTVFALHIADIRSLKQVREIVETCPRARVLSVNPEFRFRALNSYPLLAICSAYPAFRVTCRVFGTFLA
jgi:hypothetical protein